jgi:hypothetical protein
MQQIIIFFIFTQHNMFRPYMAIFRCLNLSKLPHCIKEQFRQIQTPEDGHIGPKHVVLSESEKNINLLHYRRNW